VIITINPGRRQRESGASRRGTVLLTHSWYKAVSQASLPTQHKHFTHMQLMSVYSLLLSCVLLMDFVCLYARGLSPNYPILAHTLASQFSCKPWLATRQNIVFVHNTIYSDEHQHWLLSVTNIRSWISRQWRNIPLKLPNSLLRKATWRQYLYKPNSDLALICIKNNFNQQHYKNTTDRP